MKNKKSAEYYINYLKSIYVCKVPFELLVIDKKPKTKSGVYIFDSHRIRIYAKWGDVIPLEEIAIHEYAHHIHYTEQMDGYERPHGPQFWEIYGALMCIAEQKGLYKEKIVSDISRG